MPIHRRLLTYFFAFSTGLVATASHAHTIELDQQQLQQTAKQYFPITQHTPLATITLSRPLVNLDHASQRFGIAVSITLASQNLIVGQGRALVDGELRYQAESGEFYLHDPKLRKISIENMPPEFQPLLQNLTAELAEQTLAPIRVYQLQDDDIKQRILRNRLQSVSIRDDKLILKLGPPRNQSQ